MAAERARNNLSRYFSPNIVELLAAQDEPLGAGRRETVAVLFADIVAFTRMAEVMAPEDVLAMLREFHTRMTAQIFASGGTVDQYMGDGIIAVFGATAASPNDAAKRAELRRDDARGARTLEPRTRGEGRRPARYRHRPQLRPGGARRCRQRTQHVVHSDRGHGQHGGATAGADPLAENAVGRRGRCCSGGPSIVLGSSPRIVSADWRTEANITCEVGRARCGSGRARASRSARRPLERFPKAEPRLGPPAIPSAWASAPCSGSGCT